MRRNLVTLLVIAFSIAARAQSDPTLSSSIKENIINALVSEDGEYAVRAKYAAIVTKFGTVQPYAFIRNAENYHILALEGILKKYGITPPTDRYAGKVTAPATIAEAATEGIRMEERTTVLYERLLASASGNAEVTRVVQNLYRMTRESHLPAFKAAAESGGSLTADQIRMRVWQKRQRS